MHEDPFFIPPNSLTASYRPGMTMTDFEKLLKTIELIPGAAGPASLIDAIQSGLRQLFTSPDPTEPQLSEDVKAKLADAVDRRGLKEDEYVKFLES